MRNKKKCLMCGMLCLGLTFLGGCRQVTKEAEEKVYTLEEQTVGTWPDVCAVYELEDAKVDFAAVYKNLLQEDAEYLVTDYTQKDSTEGGKEATVTGKELLSAIPSLFNACYERPFNGSNKNLCKHITLDAEEMLCLYGDLDQELQLYYKTKYGEFLSCLCDNGGFPKKEWKGQEIEGLTLSEAKKQTIEFFKNCGIEVSDDMDIYGIKKEQLIDFHVEQWSYQGEEEQETRQDVEQQYIKDGYYIHAYIVANNIRILDNPAFAYGADAEYRKIPLLTLFLTDQGVQYARVENYEQIGKTIEEKKIVAYEQVVDALKDTYNGVDTEDMYEFDAGRLAYLPEEQKGKMIIKPVWYFQGKQTKSIKEGKEVSDVSVIYDAYTGKKID